MIHFNFFIAPNKRCVLFDGNVYFSCIGNCFYFFDSQRRQRARELNNLGVVELHINGTSTDDEESQGVIAKRDADLRMLNV